ncbi:hypothetical protein R3X27_18840 [Tropicimonas sp. TH_r6]|uniref:hypothetical protein n=1 Tax=Tropicimonas sp. TH_r6 TaxID=3082085 RepID=UPI0029558F84|nr:hypothetical protein [Tropicimonas sp. TH_r6]MDV7144743.1 hypothetical protein [Tropicimonas sp. TH_r6]
MTDKIEIEKIEGEAPAGEACFRVTLLETSWQLSAEFTAVDEAFSIMREADAALARADLPPEAFEGVNINVYAADGTCQSLSARELLEALGEFGDDETEEIDALSKALDRDAIDVCKQITLETGVDVEIEVHLENAWPRIISAPTIMVAVVRPDDRGELLTKATVMLRELGWKTEADRDLGEVRLYNETGRTDI